MAVVENTDVGLHYSKSSKNLKEVATEPAIAMLNVLIRDGSY